MNALTIQNGQTFTPNSGDTRALRNAFGKFATGVTVITCSSDQGPVCITANSFSSISLDPALVMWAIDKSSRRFAFFEHAEHYAIHVLSEKQADLCAAAAKDGFALAGIPHAENMNGVPLIEGCLARFECERAACHEAGDHVIVVGEVRQVEMRKGQPLAFYAGEFGTFAR